MENRSDAPAAATNSSLLRLAAASGCCLGAEALLEVVLGVWAYQAGGPGLVSLVAAVVFFPAAFVTPAIMVMAERSAHREVVLRLIAFASAALIAFAALAMRVDQSNAVVILFAASALSLGAAFPPLESGLLPWLARTPDELIAAHRWSSIARNVGTLGGPVAGALCVGLGGPSTGALVAGGVLVIGVALVASVRTQAQHVDLSSPRPTFGGLVRLIVDGGRMVARPPGVLTLVVVRGVVVGALDVLVVVIALDLFDLGGDAVGWLRAALGLGGVLGGVVSSWAVRNDRLACSFTAAVGCLGLPLMAVWLGKGAAVAYGAMLVIGLVNAIVDVALRSLLPRAHGAARVGRVMASSEFFNLFALSVGAAIATGLIYAAGIRGTFQVLGLALVITAVLFARQMRRLDATMPKPGPEAGLLRKVPMFSPLPLAVIEHLCARLESHRYEDGAVVMREGDTGDVYHLIVTGTAEAAALGTPLRTMGVGDGFGEIALLRDIPRTATVTASGPLTTVTLRREDFLAAVTGHNDASAAAALIAEQRLANG